MKDKEIIQRLREKAATLLAAADILEGDFERATGLLTPAPTSSKGVTRIDQLIDLFMRQVPLKRSEIMKTTGIPRGTLGVIMVKKNGFKQDDQGRWFYGK